LSLPLIGRDSFKVDLVATACKALALLRMQELGAELVLSMDAMLSPLSKDLGHVKVIVRIVYYLLHALPKRRVGQNHIYTVYIR
jgi:hypothetical protein